MDEKDVIKRLGQPDEIIGRKDRSAAWVGCVRPTETRRHSGGRNPAPPLLLVRWHRFRNGSTGSRGSPWSVRCSAPLSSFHPASRPYETTSQKVRAGATR